MHNVPAFLKVEDYTSVSSDLNPFDYELWDILEQNICWECHPNLKSFKWNIIEEAAKTLSEIISKSIGKWSEYLQLYID